MKVYVLEQVNRKTNYSGILGIFDKPKSARKFHDKMFNNGESTRGKWKKCPNNARRYEFELYQFFISEYNVWKDKP